jgi:CBS-domain-containing membrane protein
LEATDIMIRAMAAVLPHDPLDVVNEKLCGQEVRRLRVTNPDDQLVGIIAWADLVFSPPEEVAFEGVTELV